MEVEITLKNYRCFPDSTPARFTIRKGITGFIGVNNSGKSSLLKFFYEFRDLFQKLRPDTENELRAALLGQGGLNLSRSVFDAEEVFSNTNTRDLEIQCDFTAQHKASPLAVTQALFIIPRGSTTYSINLYVGNQRVEIGGNQPRIQGTGLHMGGPTPVAELDSLFQFCRSFANTLYIGPFRNVLNFNSNEDYFDIKVGQAVVQTWREYKLGNSKQQQKVIQDLTRNLRHLFGFEALEVNPSSDGQTLQLLVNEKPYKLPELGAGLVQFIIVLTYAAIKKPAWILIDEPELNLHPTLQLEFLTTLGSYASEGVLFATHSIGLARAGADFIYSVRKAGDGKRVVFSIC